VIGLLPGVRKEGKVAIRSGGCSTDSCPLVTLSEDCGFFSFLGPAVIFPVSARVFPGNCP
jgi:hypothetical protein